MSARLIIARRKHLGLSHKEIAARAAISPATVLTLERASHHSSFINPMRVCAVMGFDHGTFLYEVERRLEAAGKPFLPDPPVESEREFIKSRSTSYMANPTAVVRRQLRLLGSLTLPSKPAPPAKKRKASRRHVTPVTMRL